MYAAKCRMSDLLTMWIIKTGSVEGRNQGTFPENEGRWFSLATARGRTH